jgi:DNA polymerase-3 subunit beta
MKGSFTARPHVFASAVSWVAKWPEAKPSVPAHACLLLNVEGGTLTISGYSENVTARAKLDVEGDATGGALVSARLLDNLVATFPERAVTVEAEDGRLIMSAGKFRVTLPTLPEEDFPELPDTAPAVGTVDGDALADVVSRIGVATSKDTSTRIVLACIHLSFGPESVSVMATDAIRAARTTMPWRERTPVTDQESPEALVLGGMAMDAAKAFAGPDPIVIGRSGAGIGSLSLTSPTRSLVLRTIGDRYLTDQLRQWMAVEHPASAVIAAGDMAGPIKRAAMVRGKDAPVRLVFTHDTVTVAAQADETDQASDDEVSCQYDGPDAALVVNPTYLAQGLQSVPGGTVLLAFNPEEHSHILLTSPEHPEFRHIMVPIKSL